MKRYYVRFFTMDAVKKKEIRAGGQTDVQIFWFSIGIFLWNIDIFIIIPQTLKS